MNRLRSLAALLALVALVSTGCSSTPKTEAQKQADYDVLVSKARASIEELKAADPDVEEFFDSAAGWAVFPKIGKGGLVVGGGHGKGVVFERGTFRSKDTGSTSVSFGSVGLQIGGQAFSQIIFFQTKSALASFKGGNMEFAADATAVAADAGASASAAYEGGVAVFVWGERGLMAEASIGGQKFSYVPN